jgi:hypothetical protein
VGSTAEGTELGPRPAEATFLRAHRAIAVPVAPDPCTHFRQGWLATWHDGPASTATDAGRWGLAIAGFELLEVWSSGETYLVVHGTRTSEAFAEAPQAQISLARRFDLSEPGGGRLSDGSGRWEDLVLLLALRPWLSGPRRWVAAASWP